MVLRKRKAKRREEYLRNRDDELESSRIRYDADAEQKRDIANLESNRASILLRCELLRGGVMN